MALWLGSKRLFGEIRGGLMMSFFQNTCKPEGLGGKIMVTTMNMGGHAALVKRGMSHLAMKRQSAKALARRSLCDFRTAE
ncbi:MAG: hypothetical protein LUI39_04625 [Lachnospiraceae bacterium]|nr:hypothetical protein [Lachnospiraceae bacterium]